MGNPKQIGVKVKVERVYLWDNIKGVLMFLVVFGHFLMPYISTQPVSAFLFQGIYLFHMPAFVFVSGYFSSMVSDNNKAIVKLAIAYVIFNYSMMFYAGYVQGLPFSFLEPYYSYWYLLALIAWRIMGTSIMKYRLVFPLSLVVAIAVGFWSDIDNTFAASRIIGFWPFYIAGYKFSKIDLNKLIEKKGSYLNIIWGLLGVVFLFYANVLLIGIPFNELVWHPYESEWGALYRAAMFFVSFFMIAIFIKVIPNRKLLWLTEWGRNSLSIFILHRILVFIFLGLFMFIDFPSLFYPVLILMSLAMMFLLGNDKVGNIFNGFLNNIYEAILGKDKKSKPRMALAIKIFVLFALTVPVISHVNLGLEGQETRNLLKPRLEDPIYQILSDKQLNSIEEAVSIAFVGDLILLKDQVREAWCSQEQKHNFGPVFEYAKPYLQKADFAIGVLEGPVAGKELGYSTSNYDDGIPLYLNFPDSFANAIADSGIDLVTLANNHLLDYGEEGAFRTMNYLDQIPLDYTGAYRNCDEREAVKIIDVQGLKLAVLSYTFPSNYYTEKYFFEENTSITSILVDKNSPYFRQSLAQVKDDFEKAKAEDPDFILVLPHMGTQFIHETDPFQDLWNDIFIENGADIILTAHSHAVQPIEFRHVKDNNQLKTAVIVNCPGNFVNSYVDYNGDATAIVKVYLDPNKKDVTCASVTPMWTHAPINGVHRALPVYDILHNPALESEISIFEMERVEEVQSIVTSVMLGNNIPLHQAQQEYFLFPDGYYRQITSGLHLSEEMKNSVIYELLESSSSVCFVGDSITEGSRNGGYGWFEPLAEAVEGLNYSRVAWPGATTKTLLDNIDTISAIESDVYIIAIGANDIRYRDGRTCAMTAEEYIDNIDQLTKSIIDTSGYADFVFISPWPVFPFDPYSTLSPEEKGQLYVEYETALKEYCQKSGYTFINPRVYIENILVAEVMSNYLIDHIHPNASAGISMFSEAVVRFNKDALYD